MGDGRTNYDKGQRMVGIYTKLLRGHFVYKAEEAVNYNVNERTIQRDFSGLRYFFDEFDDGSGIKNSLKYDGKRKAYYLEQTVDTHFTNSEILAICKILLDSRAFTKKEMSALLDKLVRCCVPEENLKLVKDLIGNEEFHYVEPRHKKVFIDSVWDLGQAIHSNRYIEIEYQKMKDKEVVKRRLKPAAILFSEFYFYLAAFIEDDQIRQKFEVVDDVNPTFYRFDRILSYKILEERFHRPYSERFQEGEFRKRIQFMYGGREQTVRFRYSGYDIDAVLDRLPTAKVQSEKDGVYTVRATVFGKGIDMWLRSQGEWVEVIEEEVRE